MEECSCWKQEDQWGDCVHLGPRKSLVEMECAKRVINRNTCDGAWRRYQIGLESLQTDMQVGPRCRIERGREGWVEE